MRGIKCWKRTSVRWDDQAFTVDTWTTFTWTRSKGNYFLFQLNFHRKKIQFLYFWLFLNASKIWNCRDKNLKKILKYYSDFWRSQTHPWSLIRVIRNLKKNYFVNINVWSKIEKKKLSRKINDQFGIRVCLNNLIQMCYFTGRITIKWDSTDILVTYDYNYNNFYVSSSSYYLTSRCFVTHLYFWFCQQTCTYICAHNIC